MKKRSLVVAILVVLLLSMTALAANRAVTTFADVTVTGTSANCTVSITGARDDEIDVVIKLFENGRRIQTWTDSATTYYRFNETARVNGGPLDSRQGSCGRRFFPSDKICLFPAS